jgi:hypothetical protein
MPFFFYKKNLIFLKEQRTFKSQREVKINGTRNNEESREKKNEVFHARENLNVGKDSQMSIMT